MGPTVGHTGLEDTSGGDGSCEWRCFPFYHEWEITKHWGKQAEGGPAVSARGSGRRMCPHFPGTGES